MFSRRRPVAALPAPLPALSQSPRRLPTPTGEEVVLQCGSAGARFAVDRATLLRFAVVPRNLLNADEAEILFAVIPRHVLEVNDAELLLEGDFATRGTVAALALWLQHHKDPRARASRTRRSRSRRAGWSAASSRGTSPSSRRTSSRAAT
jgi:hypothetical protein